MKNQQSYYALDSDHRRNLLVQFLSRVAIAVVTAFIVQVFVTLSTRTIHSVITNILILVAFVGVIVARWLVAHQRPKTGLVVYLLSICTPPVIAVFVAPNTSLVLILVPIMALATIIPYTYQHQFRTFLPFVFVASVMIAFGGQFAQSDAIVNTITRSGVVVITSVAVGALLLLLRRYHTWLTDAIQDTNQRNLELISEHEQLEKIIAQRTAQLAQQNDQLSSLHQSAQLARAETVSAREAERRRLQRDLHDGLGPTLSSLILGLDAVRNFTKSQPDLADALVLELREQAKTSVMTMRQLIYNLRPPELDKLGLLMALRAEKQRESLAGLHINMILPDYLPPLSAAVEVAIYRIVQEAITNIIKHAQAQHCTLNLSVIENAIEAVVTDDGVGLPDDDLNGIGLNSMRERAIELGGEFNLTRLAGNGTQVWVRLPLLDT
jgi:signal transduction histidine kinase